MLGALIARFNPKPEGPKCKIGFRFRFRGLGVSVKPKHKALKRSCDSALGCPGVGHLRHLDVSITGGQRQRPALLHAIPLLGTCLGFRV